MRKRQKRFNYGQRCTPVSLDDYSMDNISVYNSVRRKGALRASKRSYGNPAFDDSVCIFVVYLKRLHNFIVILNENSMMCNLVIQLSMNIFLTLD